jgi:hypothetical protein
MPEQCMESIVIFIRKVTKLTIAITKNITVTDYIYNAILSRLTPYMCVDSDIKNQLLIRCSAFIQYWRKKLSTIGQKNSCFTDFKKAYDSIRGHVLHNFLTEFSTSIKLVKLIKMCLHETYSKDHTDKHLFDAVPIQNDRKQEDSFSPSLFNFALKDTIRKVQENKKEWN